MNKIISRICETDLNNMSFTYDDIIDGSIVKNELLINYGIWSFIHNENVTSKDALQGLWTHFCNTYGNEIERIFNALNEDYEILDNYNGTTTTTIGQKTTTIGEKTQTMTNGQQSITMQHGATSVTMGGGTDTSTDSVANSETSVSGSFLDDRKTTQVIANKTNTSNAYTDTNTANEYTNTNRDSGNTVTDSGNTITETKHGNLGVTTSQQMVSNETLLRKQNNFYRIIIEDMFLHNYLFIID